jgi:putative tryptophan/tyrosine transport system substrate-binding protein
MIARSFVRQWRLGWRARGRAACGLAPGPKSSHGRQQVQCETTTDFDMKAQVWTRGEQFPLDQLEIRLKWPSSGSRRLTHPLTDTRQFGILHGGPGSLGGRMSLDGLRRREFITLLGGASAWPLAANAQQREKLPTIGILGASAPSASPQLWGGFVERLRTLGWIEDRTLAIEYRWAYGRDARYAEIAAEFVRLNVTVIVTAGTAAVSAARQATSAIPIVFAAAGDPVGTGLSGQQTDTAAKRVELLREVVPGLRRLAILANIGSAGAVSDMHEVETTARSIGIDPVTVQIRGEEEIGPAFDALKGRVEALYVVVDPLINAQQIRINTLALGARLPTMHDSRENVETGGLMSYGPNRVDMYRRAGDLVDKILRGAKPADIPVEQPTKFDFIINLTTAKAIGLTVPPNMLARADAVIE